MLETQTLNRSRTKTKLFIDVAIFVAFLVAMDPRTTGVAVHEWLGTSALAAVVIHLLLSWDWIIQITHRLKRGTNNQTRINYVLNWILFLDVTVLMFSGFMISEQVMPFLGINLPQNFTWRSLHELTSNVFLVLLGLHTALHWNWIVNTFRRYLFQPIGRIFSTNSRKDVTA